MLYQLQTLLDLMSFDRIEETSLQNHDKINQRAFLLHPEMDIIKSGKKPHHESPSPKNDHQIADTHNSLINSLTHSGSAPSP